MLSPHEQPAPRSGQRVWVDGRQAAFRYVWGSSGAVVHYLDESDNRVVPLAKLSLTPPRREDRMLRLLDREPTEAERRTHAAGLLE